jgi:hypothetical protein
MKKTQRDCLQFGNLVMEGRDIGTNVFPETDYKYYLDAQLEERSRRRAAEGVQENLAARDQRDSQRAAAPLMIALGARVINNSEMTAERSLRICASGWRSTSEMKSRVYPSYRVETSNIEHRTSNIEVITVRRGHSMFGVRCSMFDVRSRFMAFS